MALMPEKLKKLVAEADGDALDHLLDELVHDTAQHLASEINNQGPSEQIKYLLNNGWTAEQLEEEIGKAKS